MATSLISQAINEAGETFLDFMNNDLPRATRKSVTAGLNFMDLEIALLFSLGYVLLVIGGYLIKGKEVKEEKAKSLAQKFSREPILYPMVVYNLVQVALCGYMMVTAALVALRRGFSPLCNAFENEPTSKDLVNVLHLFYLSKVSGVWLLRLGPGLSLYYHTPTLLRCPLPLRASPHLTHPPTPFCCPQILDYLDTVFIIARGKWNQFSFLHVYHHLSIFLVYWMVANAAYDGDVYYTIVANSFIHFVMYAYYAATALENDFARKFNNRYALVTNLQLLQFVTMMVQGAVLVVGQCAYPRNVTLFYIAYIASLFLLFSDFKGKRYEASPASSPTGGAASPNVKGASSSTTTSTTTATKRGGK
jgi:hypothetical protein